jgi:hypothetical protein
MIVILDTPFYEDRADGERMMAERVGEFRRKYGIPEELARRAGYLTKRQFEQWMSGLPFTWRLQDVWPGIQRKYEEIRGRLVGRRVARFPLVVIEKRG